MSEAIVYRGDYEVAQQLVRVLAHHHIAAAIQNPPSPNVRYRAYFNYRVAVVVREDDSERAVAAIREWQRAQPEAVARHTSTLFQQVRIAVIPSLLWLILGHLSDTIPPPTFAAFVILWLAALVVVAQVQERRRRAERAA
jgi:hypothetical protein